MKYIFLLGIAISTFHAGVGGFLNAQDLDSLHHLQANVERLTKGTGQQLDPSVVQSARDFRIAVHTALEGNQFERLPIALFQAIDASHAASNLTEWKDYASAENGLRNLTQLLERSITSKSEAAPIVMTLAERHIGKWLMKNPKECVNIMDAIELQYAAVAAPSTSAGWYFSKVEFERELRANSMLSRDQLKQRLDTFIGNDAIPIRDRVYMMAVAARCMYMDGTPEIADKYMSDFQKLHPEAMKSINFRHAWFFNALLGLGDRVRARMLITRLEEAVSDPSTSARSGPAFAMCDMYYSKLLLTDDELRRVAWVEMNERRKNHKQ